MNCALFIMVVALAIARSFAGDPPSQSVPGPGSEAQAGKAQSETPSQTQNKECVMLVGPNSKTLPNGYEVCWRHPEYLTCNNGNWAPHFCPYKQMCVENAGKVSCVPLPEGYVVGVQLQNPSDNSAANTNTAPRNTNAGAQVDEALRRGPVV